MYVQLLRLAFFVLERNTRGFGCCSGLEYQTGDVFVAFTTGNMQGGVTMAIGNVDVAGFFQEAFYRLKTK